MRRLFKLIALFSLALWIGGSAAAAATLTALDVRGAGAQTRLSLAFDGEVAAPEPRFVDARRIILDFPELGESLSGEAIAGGQEMLPGRGVVRRVRYAPRGAEGLRLVLDLAGDAAVSDTRAGDTAAGTEIVMMLTALDGALDGPLDGDGSAAAAVPVPSLKPAPASRPVIVIDPGHGGSDPGAIGKARNTFEKTITFSASRTLAEKLRATGRYEVVLTRERDVYVAHEERLRIARRKGADLFISIHADSAASDASGASVYTLADRAKTRSRRLVRSQNWIMDVDLADQSDAVGDILVDLAQRKTNSQSDRFADLLVGEVAATTPMVRNSHRRAGYFVLLAPDVPAVLLELGFLSNASDEALLNRAPHRAALMDAVVRAIDGYFEDG